MNKNDTSFALMRERYDTVEFKHWGQSIVARGLRSFEKKLISQYLSAAKTVLDVGCGGGREAFALSQLGFTVTGIDLSPRMIAAARQYAESHQISNVVFAVANVCELPLADSSFDAAIALEKVINHIPRRADRIRALREIRRVLKPNGILLAVSNSVNANFKYQLYFKMINILRKIYNPHNYEMNNIHPFKTGGRYAMFKQRPIFHWYTASEFIDDLISAGFNLLDFISADEVMRERDFNLRERGGQICYLAKKYE